MPEPATRPWTISFRTPEGEVRAEADEKTTLLEAAAEAGLELPHTCLQGWCITCAALLKEGRVDHPDALRYYEEDRAAGFILLCSAEPRSDVVVQTHAKDAMRAHRARHGLPAPQG